MKDHLTSALAQLNGSADWNRRTGGTLPAKLTCFEAQDVLTALQELQQRAEQAEREVERLTARESNQSERIRYLEGATNHATGTPLTHMKARAERAEADTYRIKLAAIGAIEAASKYSATGNYEEADLVRQDFADKETIEVFEKFRARANRTEKAEAELAKERARLKEMAAELAHCAGYIASVRTDRQITWHEELYALQTVEWAEGAVEIAEKANAVLEAHDAAMKEDRT